MTKPTPQPDQQTFELTSAQQRHAERLVAELNRAAAAQQTALAAANGFIAYCADEHGIKVGVDGWTYNQGLMRFERVPAPDKKEQS